MTSIVGGIVTLGGFWLNNRKANAIAAVATESKAAAAAAEAAAKEAIVKTGETHDAVNHFQKDLEGRLVALQKELDAVRAAKARGEEETLALERERATAPKLLDPNGDEVHAEKPAPVVLADVAPEAIRTLTAATPPPPEKGRL